jgi:hypothetical protein
VLRGTLVETYNRCGPNCRCVDGPGHGPKRYLSISKPGGRARRGHVPNGVFVHVAELIDNFRKMRETLNEICAINARTSRRWSAMWRWVIGAIFALQASRLAPPQSHRLRSVPLLTPPSRQRISLSTPPIQWTTRTISAASGSISAISS